MLPGNQALKNAWIMLLAKSVLVFWGRGLAKHGLRQAGLEEAGLGVSRLGSEYHFAGSSRWLCVMLGSRGGR